MNRITKALCADGTLIGSTLPAMAAADKAKLDERLSDAQSVLNEIMSTPDKAVPNQILVRRKLRCGHSQLQEGCVCRRRAQYGQGVATCRTGHGWSAPVFVQLTGGSFGFQIGGQATDLVLLGHESERPAGHVEE